MPSQFTTHSGGNGFTKEESAKGISYPNFAQSTYHYLGLLPNFSRPDKPVDTYEVTLVKMHILEQRTPILCNILTLPVYFSKLLFFQLLLSWALRSLTIEIVALPAMVIILTVLIVLFLVPSVFLAHGAQVWGQSLTNPNSCLLFVL